MSDTLYIKMSQTAEVTTTSITLSDVAKIECSDKKIANHLKPMQIMKIPATSKQRYIVSVMNVIELINNEYPDILISNLGETDCIIEYSQGVKENSFFEAVKVIFICLVIFFGAAFAIMSFNNDVSVGKLFEQIYIQIMGIDETGFSIIELMYALGLAIGIIVFYNHFGRKKLSIDPTPIEVEMRLYESEINTTLIDGYNRKDDNIDVK